MIVVRPINLALCMWVHPDAPDAEKQRELARGFALKRQMEVFLRAHRVAFTAYPCLLELPSPPYGRSDYSNYKRPEMQAAATTAWPNIHFTNYQGHNANTGMGASGFAVLGGTTSVCDRYSDWTTAVHELLHNGVRFDWPESIYYWLALFTRKGRKHSGVFGRDAYSDGAFTIMGSGSFHHRRWGLSPIDLLLLGQLIPTVYSEDQGIYHVGRAEVHPESRLPWESPLLLLPFGGPMLVGFRQHRGHPWPVSSSWANRLFLYTIDRDRQSWRHAALFEGDQYPVGEKTLTFEGVVDECAQVRIQ